MRESSRRQKLRTEGGARLTKSDSEYLVVLSG
jgi:hypothetical protein